MPNLYITAAQLTNAGVAPEADTSEIFDLLAGAVSRMFDRECEVPDGFFSAAAASGVTLKSYIANGTKFLRLFPYIAGSITIIDVDGDDIFEAAAADREYRETADGYLVFDTIPCIDTPIDVTARYGFASLAADIQQACLEQALAMWRKKDLSFAEMSGVSSAAITAEFSPTFSAVANRYRGLYSQNSYFA
jgi:hypothetical protein